MRPDAEKLARHPVYSWFLALSDDEALDIVCPPERVREPKKPVRRGALKQWWKELREGRRTKTTFDNLWRRACEEYAARTAIRLPPIAKEPESHDLRIAVIDRSKKEPPGRASTKEK